MSKKVLLIILLIFIFTSCTHDWNCETIITSEVDTLVYKTKFSGTTQEKNDYVTVGTQKSHLLIGGKDKVTYCN